MFKLLRKEVILGMVVKVDKKQISGWAGDPNDSDPLTVELVLDGIVINSTTACQQVGAPQLRSGYCGWRFGMRDIWDRIGADQTLEVRVGRMPLRLWSGQRRIPILGRDPEPGDRLLDALAENQIINKFGKAIPPLDSRREWQENVSTGFAKLRRELEDKFGYTPFISYGMLLGYAREGSLIRYDNDCDLAYVSTHSEPDQVRREFLAIAEHLRRVNPNSTAHPYKVVWHGNFSITPGWFGSDGLCMSFGYVSDRIRITHGDVFPLQKAELSEVRVLAPCRPERVAEFLYGPGWRWPDAGWVWRKKWKNRPAQLAARLSDEDVARLNVGGPNRIRPAPHPK